MDVKKVLKPIAKAYYKYNPKRIKYIQIRNKPIKDIEIEGFNWYVP